MRASLAVTVESRWPTGWADLPPRRVRCDSPADRPALCGTTKRHTGALQVCDHAAWVATRHFRPWPPAGPGTAQGATPTTHLTSQACHNLPVRRPAWSDGGPGCGMICVHWQICPILSTVLLVVTVTPCPAGHCWWPWQSESALAPWRRDPKHHWGPVTAFGSLPPQYQSLYLRYRMLYSVSKTSIFYTSSIFAHLMSKLKETSKSMLTDCRS